MKVLQYVFLIGAILSFTTLVFAKDNKKSNEKEWVTEKHPKGYYGYYDRRHEYGNQCRFEKVYVPARYVYKHGEWVYVAARMEIVGGR